MGSATAENIRSFLAKRGYQTSVTKDDDVGVTTYKILLSAKRVEDVVSLLAEIKEPGRFVVSLSMEDVTDLILGDSLVRLFANITTLTKQVEALEATVGHNDRRNAEVMARLENELSRTNTAAEVSTNSIDNRLKPVESDLKKIKSTSWFKKLIGRF